MRLQSAERQVTSRQSWRQADYPQLLYWNLRVRCTGRCQHGGVRSSGNGARLCNRDKVQAATRLFGWMANMIAHTTAIFRQVNKDNPRTHHDALEFPDGQMVLLTHVLEGQEATVLQLPAQPATAAEAKAQERVAHVG